MISTRPFFPAALGASLALHGLAFFIPGAWLAPVASVSDDTPAFLTAHIVEPPAVQRATDGRQPTAVVKNTLAPSSSTPPPKPSPSRDGAAAEKARAAKAESLSEEQLGETLTRLSRTMLYPPEALRLGLEGETVLLLELDERGRIRVASVASSSGHAILDDAALRAARHLGNLGEASAGKAILLPVRFRLL